MELKSLESGRTTASVRPLKPPYVGEGATALMLGRLKRSFLRQWLFALLMVCAVMGLGAIYQYTVSALAPLPLLLWAPWALIAGALLALGLEIERNTITRPSKLHHKTNGGVIAVAPELTARALRMLPPNRRNPVGTLAFDPSSPFASAFRELQASIQRDHVVAFVSAWPNEGATTVALCAAISAQQQGRKVIILDCDLRRRTLTRMLGANTSHGGVLEACERGANWLDFVDEEIETGLSYLAAAPMRNAWRSVVGSPGFVGLIAELRKNYDLIVLDCPPALSVADGPIIAGQADRCAVVAAWDRTPMGAVRNALKVLRRHSRAVTSFCVNRVPVGYRFVAS